MPQPTVLLLPLYIPASAATIPASAPTSPAAHVTIGSKCDYVLLIGHPAAVIEVELTREVDPIAHKPFLYNVFHSTADLAQYHQAMSRTWTRARH